MNSVKFNTTQDQDFAIWLEKEHLFDADAYQAFCIDQNTNSAGRIVNLPTPLKAVI